MAVYYITYSLHVSVYEAPDDMSNTTYMLKHADGSDVRKEKALAACFTLNSKIWVIKNPSSGFEGCGFSQCESCMFPLWLSNSMYVSLTQFQSGCRCNEGEFVGPVMDWSSVQAVSCLRTAETAAEVLRRWVNVFTARSRTVCGFGNPRLCVLLFSVLDVSE